MSKFNQSASAAATGRTAPIRTTVVTRTNEGGQGWETDSKSSLFRLAAVNMVGEAKFYQSGAQSDNRFRDLIHQVTAEDPEWMQNFIPYLRNRMFMRSASVVAACEYVAAGGPNGRAVINGACSRVDELTEILSYWQNNYGGRTDVYPKRAPQLPAAVKRGLADACTRLLNEYSAMKYDSPSNSIRLGDVIELVHPKRNTPAQGALFEFLLDRRHRGNDANYSLELLPQVLRHRELEALGVNARRDIITAQNAAEVLNAAGFTWEQLSGWLQGPMDSVAWSAMIPSMGAMALIRNLRNFDEAKITDEAFNAASARISDAEAIAKSKMFPYRFWSAFKNAPTLRWGPPLEAGLGHAVNNIPELDGHTLILIDYSASMGSPVSGKGTVACWEAGALFGVAQFVKCERADLIAYGTDSVKVKLSSGTDILSGMKVCQDYFSRNGDGSHPIGHGTNTMQAILKHFDAQKHKRIVVFSDMQTHPGNTKAVLDLNVPIYSFDLGGYSAVHLPAGQKNSYLLAGFSDAAFTMMRVLEDGQHAGWPF